MRLTTATVQDDHHIRRLHNDIIKYNNPLISPVRNSSDTTTVWIDTHLTSISDFDAVTQTVISNGFFAVSWKDEFLTWNASDYGGVREISMGRCGDLKSWLATWWIRLHLTD